MPPVGEALRDFINGNPTRTVEHAFSWIMVVWGASMLGGEMFKSLGPDSPFGPMLSIMPAWGWGMSAITIGLLRVVALILNGHWRPSPEVRLVGAMWGAMFWIALIYTYHLAVATGAQDFPMRRALFVFLVFEIYACYRCGIDMGKRSIKPLPMASPHLV